MEPLDPQLRQLIDEGLPAAIPDDDTHDRGLAALVAHIESAPPPVPPAATATTGLTKLLVGVAAVGAVATGGWVATRSEPEPEPPPAVVAEPTPTPATQAPDPPPAAPVLQPPTAPPAVPEPAQVPVAAPAKTRRAPARKATPAPASSVADKLRAEAALIARAESALDRNKPREALALCDFHRKDFDAPQLTTERKAIAASAACMIDATDTAAAEAFLRAHPKSALAKKVRQRCSLDPAPKKTTPQ